MFKYIGLILKFSDVSKVYKEETGKDKRWWLSRTFIGSLIAFLATAVTVFFGIEISDGQVEVIVNSLSTIIPAAIALYGVVMTFIGQVKKQQEPPCETKPTNQTQSDI
jgi:uncharacterized membrane protein